MKYRIYIVVTTNPSARSYKLCLVFCSLCLLIPCTVSETNSVRGEKQSLASQKGRIEISLFLGQYAHVATNPMWDSHGIQISYRTGTLGSMNRVFCGSRVELKSHSCIDSEEKNILADFECLLPMADLTLYYFLTLSGHENRVYVEPSCEPRKTLFLPTWIPVGLIWAAHAGAP